VSDERLAELLARHRGEVRKLQVDVGRRGEEAVLAAVVAHHHRRVDAGVRGNGADGRALEAVRGEAAPGRGEDCRPRPLRPR
jgi:hypothetical protein